MVVMNEVTLSVFRKIGQVNGIRRWHVDNIRPRYGYTERP